LAAEQVGQLEMAAAQIRVARELRGAPLLAGAPSIIDRVGFHDPSPRTNTRGP
jgi:hypothetical protein